MVQHDAGCWIAKGKPFEVEAKQALWVPNYNRNLISVEKLAQQGGDVTFGKDAHIKMFDGTLLPLMLTSDDLYTLRVSPSLCNLGPRAPSVDRLPGIARSGEGYTGGSTWSGAQALSSRTLEQWHKTLGHNNYQDVARLPKLVEGMTLVGGAAPGHCDTCSTEKAKRAPVNKKWGTRAAQRLEIVHTDVLGPVHQTSYEGFRYAIGFIDSFSRYAVMYPMRSKEKVLEKLELSRTGQMWANLKRWSQTGHWTSSPEGSVMCAERTAFGKSSQRPTLLRRMARSRESGALSLEWPDA